MSISVSAIFGFFLLISLLFSIQDFEATVGSDIGQPVAKILIDIFGNSGAIALMTLAIVCVWHCGLFSLTSNSRMMYAFSRDRGMSSLNVNYAKANPASQASHHFSITLTRASRRPSVPSGSEQFYHFFWLSPLSGLRWHFQRRHRLLPSAYIFRMVYLF